MIYSAPHVKQFFARHALADSSRWEGIDSKMISHQQGHALNMVGVGEHINRLDGNKLKTTGNQELQIPAEGCQVAGNIDDFLRPAGNQLS